MAIGYAFGKRVFCFPWVNSSFIQILKPRLKTCFQVLKDNGCMIILSNGKRKAFTKMNGSWGSYMKKNRILKKKVQGILFPIGNALAR